MPRNGIKCSLPAACMHSCLPPLLSRHTILIHQLAQLSVLPLWWAHPAAAGTPHIVLRSSVGGTPRCSWHATAPPRLLPTSRLSASLQQLAVASAGGGGGTGGAEAALLGAGRVDGPQGTAGHGPMGGLQVCRAQRRGHCSGRKQSALPGVGSTCRATQAAALVKIARPPAGQTCCRRPSHQRQPDSNAQDAQSLLPGDDLAPRAGGGGHSRAWLTRPPQGSATTHPPLNPPQRVANQAGFRVRRPGHCRTLAPPVGPAGSCGRLQLGACRPPTATDQVAGRTRPGDFCSVAQIAVVSSPTRPASRLRAPPTPPQPLLKQHGPRLEPAQRGAEHYDRRCACQQQGGAQRGHS